MKTSTLLLIIVTLGIAASAAAQPKPNVFDGGDRWLITAFDDTSPVHQELATQSICFLPFVIHGTNIQGVWFSTSFPNWRGRYSQEGDRVEMHGDYANGVGHDGMDLELSFGTSPRDEGSGQWTEWRSNSPFGTTIGFGNLRLRRVGACPRPAAAAKPSAADLEKFAVEQSGRVAPRMKTDGKPAQSPLEAGQVPLKE